MNHVRHYVRRAVGIVLLLIIWTFGFGQAVLQLWNHLVPQIFGLRPIGFWEAVGLMSLSWLLFGGFRGLRPMRMGRRHARMTPEQREQFRKSFEGRRCSPSRAPEPAS